MCIAIYKKQGVEMPTKKIFKNCFERNNDGAGYMFAYNGKVYIQKGFMKFNDFYKSIKGLKKRFNLKDIPMVFHFRITTQGGVNQGLTHPFPLCNSYDEMLKTSTVCDYGVAHNGIISCSSSYSANIKHNDTMEFIKEILSPLITKSDYYKDKNKMSVINYLLGTNRVVILSGNGHAEMIGDWIEEDGIYYSNDSYNKSSYFGKNFTKVSYSSLWYDDDDYFGYETPNCFSGKTNEQIMLESGELYCKKCGGEMYIYYDDATKKWLAYCVDCGREIVLTKKEIETAIEMGIIYGGDEYEYEYGKVGA